MVLKKNQNAATTAAHNNEEFWLERECQGSPPQLRFFRVGRVHRCPVVLRLRAGQNCIKAACAGFTKCAVKPLPLGIKKKRSTTKKFLAVDLIRSFPAIIYAVGNNIKFSAAFAVSFE